MGRMLTRRARRGYRASTPIAHIIKKEAEKIRASIGTLQDNIWESVWELHCQVRSHINAASNAIKEKIDSAVRSIRHAGDKVSSNIEDLVNTLWGRLIKTMSALSDIKNHIVTENSMAEAIIILKDINRQLAQVLKLLGESK